MSMPEKRPSVVSSTIACVCHPNRRGSMRVVKPRITPSRRSRSTRRLTAGAVSATWLPMSWNERRASSRSSAMICRSIASISARSSTYTQRIAIATDDQQADHCPMALAMEALAHEEIRVQHGPRTGLPMVVAVHRTHLGRSLGGCRLWSYPDVDAAIADAERLSEAMTFKAAAANLPVGGGKAVIALPPGERLDGPRRQAAFHDFAELVDALQGRYVTAEDVGVGEDDMAEIARHTRHVVGGPVALGGAGDPSPYTALGVELAIRTALGEDSLEGAAVTVAGLGHVGASLATLLARGGAHLTVTDLDPAKRALALRLGARWVDPEEAIAAGGDVFSPCALGGVLTLESAARLRVAVVAGAANNQLAAPGVAAALRDRGILWAPDFIANAGGLVHVAAELDGYDAERVRRGISAIGDTLRTVFDRAQADDTTTLAAAEALVAERLAARH